jgi:hypothetical protein
LFPFLAYLSFVLICFRFILFFVIPVIVVDDVGGFAAIERSWHLFKSTWGETVVGSFSLALVIATVALQGIFVAIMYRYATMGDVPDTIDRSLVEGAFVPKGSCQ